MLQLSHSKILESSSSSIQWLVFRQIKISDFLSPSSGQSPTHLSLVTTSGRALTLNWLELQGGGYEKAEQQCKVPFRNSYHCLLAAYYKARAINLSAGVLGSHIYSSAGIVL